MAQELSGEALEPEDAGEQLAALGEAFAWVEKALRSFQMYAAEHEVCQKFRATVTDKLIGITDRFGDTWIEIQAHALCFGDKEFYRGEGRGEGFVFALHRDGIRRICLRTGLQEDEVHRFLGVLSTDLDDPRYFDADMVTLLWDASLAHVRYIAAELLAETRDDDEELQHYRELMNEIIAAAGQATVPEGAGGCSERPLLRLPPEALANLSPEKLAATALALDADGAAGGPDAGGQEALERLRSRHDEPGLLLKFTEVLHRGLIRRSGERAPIPLGSFDLLLQALVASGRYVDLMQVCRLVHALGEAPGAGRDAARRMLACLTEQSRLGRLVSALDGGEEPPEPVLQVLRLVPVEGVSQIVAAGAELTRREARRRLVEVLVGLVVDEPERMAPHLRAAHPPEVKLACQILVGVGNEQALAALVPLHRHPDPELRATLLRATRSASRPELRRVRLALLDDDSPLVRAQAEQVLVELDDPELAPRLCRRIVKGGLKGCSMLEKRRVCELIGARGGEGERAGLVDLLQRGSVLRGGQQSELSAAAAYGLAATGDPALAEVLSRRAGHRLTSKIVREAAREALSLLQSGQSGPPQPTGRTAVVDPGRDPATPGPVGGESTAAVDRAPAPDAAQAADPVSAPAAGQHAGPGEGRAAGTAPRPATGAAPGPPAKPATEPPWPGGLDDYGFVSLDEPSPPAAGGAGRGHVAAEPPELDVPPGASRDGLDEGGGGYSVSRPRAERIAPPRQASEAGADAAGPGGRSGAAPAAGGPAGDPQLDALLRSYLADEGEEHD